MNYVLQYGNLTVLDISNNHLGDLGVEQLSVGLIGKITLRKLYMTNCKFGQLGAEEFFRNIGNNASLTHLKIDWNKIGKGKPRGPGEDINVISSFEEFLSTN